MRWCSCRLLRLRLNEAFREWFGGIPAGVAAGAIAAEGVAISGGGELDISGGGELESGVHSRLRKNLPRGRELDSALGIAMRVLMSQALWTASRCEYIEVRLWAVHIVS
jgi:hypothetical protein